MTNGEAREAVRSLDPRRLSLTLIDEDLVSVPATDMTVTAVRQCINAAVVALDAPVPALTRGWSAGVKPLKIFLCTILRCSKAVRITRENAQGPPQVFSSSKCRSAYSDERAYPLDKQRPGEASARPGGTFRERQLMGAAFPSVGRCLLHSTYSATATREGDA